ncbi:MAG TPA: hypothetical protein VFR58_14160 [Flavisolibacter sp.]|nr:hypothetical protein [Flavisolibacter sp.]
MSTDIQARLFGHIRTILPAEASLVDEIAAVLQISTDSAYRRIRGDKVLAMDEAYRLCLHFGLSLDSLCSLRTEGYLFNGKFVQADSFRFDDYLSSLVQQVKYMSGFRNPVMYYLCKDIPIFHHFHFRELAAFKYYFWMKNILHLPEFAHKKFSLDLYPNEFFELGRQGLAFYNRIGSVELWNIESVNSTLRQVEFYQDSNIFENNEQIYMIYEALEKLIDHLELQATRGFKSDAQDPAHTPGASFKMYFNEIVILENSILATLDESKAAFLVHNVLNFLVTRDVSFCENMHSYIQNLIRKSTLISMVSERERARFFKHLRQRIVSRKQHCRKG